MIWAFGYNIAAIPIAALGFAQSADRGCGDGFLVVLRRLEQLAVAQFRYTHERLIVYPNRHSMSTDFIAKAACVRSPGMTSLAGVNGGGQTSAQTGPRWCASMINPELTAEQVNSRDHRRATTRW